MVTLPRSAPANHPGLEEAAVPYFDCMGRRLHYVEKGAGPLLLLLLPGDTSSAAMHDEELEHFADRYRTVCLDFWGTGRSERAARWPATWWEQCVEDTASLIHHLAQGPALVVGQSGGAAIALKLAVAHPSTVRALISDSQVERLPQQWLRDIVARQRVPSPTLVAFWRKAHGDDWRRVVDADQEAILARAEQGDIDWYQGRLDSISCPVLLTGSLADRVMPDLPTQILSMARQIPHCHIYFATRGNHPLMWTNPAPWRRAADCFLAAQPGCG